MLREEQLAVGHDIEDARVSHDQLGFDVELIANRGRQTGGLRLVVSTPAVRDGQTHGIIP
jgi:hypothetical protein